MTNKITCSDCKTTDLKRAYKFERDGDMFCGPCTERKMADGKIYDMFTVNADTCYCLINASHGKDLSYEEYVKLSQEIACLCGNK